MSEGAEHKISTKASDGLKGKIMRILIKMSQNLGRHQILGGRTSQMSNVHPGMKPPLLCQDVVFASLTNSRPTGRSLYCHLIFQR